MSAAGVQFSDRTTTVNAVRLHYVIGGSGPAVLLVTGFPQTWYSWRKVMPALARRHTVIAIDSPGVGESSVPSGGYDARSIAADLSALVQRLKLGRVSIVGHDLGGWVAYAFARFHPDQAERLAILEAGIPGFGLERRLDWSAPGRGALWHVIFFMQRGVAERLLEGRERDFLTRFLGPDRPAAGTFSGGAVEEYVRAYARPGRLAAAFGQYRSFYRDLTDNRAGGAPKLSLPVLALGGARANGALPLAQARQAARDVRGGVVPSAGHWLMEERPAYVTARLRHFLG